MDLLSMTALGTGAAWAAGINAYAVILALGLLGSSGQLTLPSDLMILTHPAIIGAAGFMYCVEFFADKIPGVDSIWDALQTFVRIPAGAVLAAGAFGELDPVVQLAAALLGGGLALSSHATKTGGRLLINASPEPVTNWTASVLEDVVVFGSVWASLHHPGFLIVAVAAMVTVTLWVLPRLVRLLRAGWQRLTRRDECSLRNQQDAPSREDPVSPMIEPLHTRL